MNGKDNEINDRTAAEGSCVRSRIKLSERLMMSASRVSRCDTVADIGCDHAHSAIWLILNEVAGHVIATDLREGPLSHARENIALYGLQKRIETRLSDGLKELKPGEANTILICGMGGKLTTMILTNGLLQVSNATELVLQPQSDIGMVRRFLKDNQFTIVDEDMCIEDDKFYNTIKARNNCIAAAYRYVNTGVERFAPDWNSSQEVSVIPDDVFLEYGRLLLERRHKVLKEFLDTEYIKCLHIKSQLEFNKTASATGRLPDIVKKQRMLEVALSYY